MRSDHLGLGLDFARRNGGRRTCHRCGTRAICTQAVGCGIGVALFDHNIISRNTQFGGNDLRICGFVALALALGAHAGNNRTCGVDADFGRVEHGNTQDIAILRRASTDDFSKEGNADAHNVAGFAAQEGSAFCRLFLTQFRVTDGVHRLFHRCVVVAAVIFPAKRRMVWELLSLDEVFNTQFRSIHAKLVRQHLNSSLDRKHRLGDAERAAIGNAARGFVGVNTIDSQMRGGNIIRAGADIHETGRPF